METEIVTVVEKRNADGDFTCPFCKDETTFESENEFRSHLKELHDRGVRGGRLYCKPCNQYLSVMGYKTHIKSLIHATILVAAENMSHDDMEKILPFPCSHCNKRFTTSGICNRHEKMHTGEAYLKPSVCEICGKSFQMLSVLIVHRKHVHKEVYKFEKKKEKKIEGVFKCPHPQCPRKFARKKYLDKHIDRIHDSSKKYSCDKCEKTYTYKTGLNMHKWKKHGEMAEKEKEKFDCPVPSCKRKLEKTRLYAHMEVHHFKGMDFTKTCPYECDWKDGTEEEWIKHVEICCKDKETTDASCRRCGETFPSVFLRFFHHIKEHPDYSYTCSFCPRIYSQKFALDWHRQTHTEIRSFQCTKCGKTFPQQANLKIHLNSVCNDDEEARKAFVAKRKEKQKQFMEKKKPWKCSKCGKGFIEERRMIAHQNDVHNDSDSE